MMYKFPFSLQEHMKFHLHLKFLSYALYKFNLQEIAMPLNYRLIQIVVNSL